MTGRMYPEWWGKLSALIVFIGFNLTFFPQFLLGYLGMPRRYYEYPAEFQVLNVMSTAGASILAVGYVLPLGYLLLSLRYGKIAPENPWHATGLEWTIASPPIKENFETTPIVTEGPYDYSPQESEDRSNAARAEPRTPQPHETDDGPVLAHHFDDPEQQKISAELGMWTFLATEVMFFGGLFAAYTVYRNVHFEAFKAASLKLYPSLGGINTFVLLTSSLTMALAVRSVQVRQRKPLIGYLIATMVLGTIFLGIKFYEWRLDYLESLIPGRNFRFEGSLEIERDAQIFFLLYFLMTGIHALHMIIGITFVAIVAVACWKHHPVGRGQNQVEIMGLYWHFVDLVWVFLYPLLYLVDLHK